MRSKNKIGILEVPKRLTSENFWEFKSTFDKAGKEFHKRFRLSPLGKALDQMVRNILREGDDLLCPLYEEEWLVHDSAGHNVSLKDICLYWTADWGKFWTEWEATVGTSGEYNTRRISFRFDVPLNLVDFDQEKFDAWVEQLKSERKQLQVEKDLAKMEELFRKYPAEILALTEKIDKE